MARQQERGAHVRPICRLHQAEDRLSVEANPALTFDRPETYNSVDAQTHTQLTHIWRDINDDPDINAVIVTGAGKAFSAGGDFELIKSILDNPAPAWRRGRRPRTSSTTSSTATSRSFQPSTASRSVRVSSSASSPISRSRKVGTHRRRSHAAWRRGRRCRLHHLAAAVRACQGEILSVDLQAAVGKRPSGSGWSRSASRMPTCRRRAGDRRRSGERCAERDPLDQIRVEQLAARQWADIRYVDRAGDPRLHRRRGAGGPGVASGEAQAGISAGLSDLTTEMV